MAFSNDVSTRHHHANLVMKVYKECLKNHGANLGDHIVDGYSLFMPSSTTKIVNDISMKCATCGCHQHFHRCEKQPPISPMVHHALDNEAHHHDHPPLSPLRQRTNFPSPQPITMYHPPPHSVGLSIMPENVVAPAPVLAPTHHSQKWFRTKFTLEQKVKMLKFAEKVGWKMQKLDKQMVNEFCNEVGVCRKVLQVWLHNNKNTFGKRDNN